MRRLGEDQEGGVDEGAVGDVAVQIRSAEPTKTIPTITPIQKPSMTPHRPTIVVASQRWRLEDVVDAAGGEGEGPRAGDQEDARGGVGEGEEGVAVVNPGCLASLLVKCPTIR